MMEDDDDDDDDVDVEVQFTPHSCQFPPTDSPYPHHHIPHVIPRPGFQLHKLRVVFHIGRHLVALRRALLHQFCVQKELVRRPVFKG